MAHAGNYNTPFMDAPDNMAGIIEYKDSYGVVEGTWTVPQISLPTGPVYMCTDGVIFCDENKEVVVMNSFGEKIEVPEAEIHPHIKNLPDHYAYAKATGTPLIKTVTLDFNVQVMSVIDGAMKSAKSGKKEKING